MTQQPADPASVSSGSAVVDRYLAEGYATVGHVVAVRRRHLLRPDAHPDASWASPGPIAEIGTFEGRFFIALAHALQPGEKRARHGRLRLAEPAGARPLRGQLPEARRRRPTSASPGRSTAATITPAELLAKTGGRKVRLFHIDGEHSRAGAGQGPGAGHRGACADDGLIVLDDMLHPGYPTLMVTVQEYLERAPGDGGAVHHRPRDDRRRDQVRAVPRRLVQALRGALLEDFKDNVWPLGADFEPHWCLVLSLDTRLAAIT